LHDLDDKCNDDPRLPESSALLSGIVATPQRDVVPYITNPDIDSSLSTLANPPDEIVKFWLSRPSPDNNVRVNITDISGEDFCKYLHEFTSVTHMRVRIKNRVMCTSHK